MHRFQECVRLNAGVMNGYRRKCRGKEGVSHREQGPRVHNAEDEGARTGYCSEYRGQEW